MMGRIQGKFIRYLRSKGCDLAESTYDGIIQEQADDLRFRDMMREMTFWQEKSAKTWEYHLRGGVDSKHI